MAAAAVVYVGALAQMRAFYGECFGLAVSSETDDFCQLTSESWHLTLVRSQAAAASTTPASRRESTPIKLGFEVTDIEERRQVINRLGGRLDPADTTWEYAGELRCDGEDPEGNVVQLIQTVSAER